MRPVSRLKSLWRNLRHRRRVEEDLDAEIRGAWQMLVDERVAAGMARADAERAAVIALGRVEAIKSHVRDVRAGSLLEAFARDVRYGARLLWHNPLFTITAALSLAICIAANTTVFSIANRLLFREAPGVADPDGLVDIATTRANGRFGDPTIPYGRYLEIRERVTTLDSLYGYQLDIQPVSLGATTGAERIFSTFVTSNYFDALGIRPAAGRLFDHRDSDEAGGSDAVVLGYGFWARRFDADPSVVGRAISINGEPLTIVGVAPQGFQGLSLVVADIWIPTPVAARLAKARTAGSLAVGGRLRPGVSLQQANAEMDTIGRALFGGLSSAPQPGGQWENFHGGSLRAVAASPLPAIVRTLISGFLTLLIGIASLVLVIACANLVGVLLARATTRRQEIAVRLALGAGRARLVRQLLTETLLLFVIGGAAGLALARVLTSVVVLALPPLPVPIDTTLPLDHRVIAFTAIVSAMAALLSGLVPALRSSRADVVSALKADAQGPSDRLRTRNLFVIAQVALSILLVVCAGLFARALSRSGSLNVGFQPEGVEVTTLDLSLAGYTAANGRELARTLLDRMRAVPGVASATVATNLPMGGGMRSCCGLSIPGLTPPDGQPVFSPAGNIVEPGYFATLGIAIVAGRDFAASDRHNTDPVAIVSAATAQEFWPNQHAVGRQMTWHKSPRFGGRGSVQGGPVLYSTQPQPPADVQLTVVGVVADIAAGARTPGLMFYVPFQQQYQPQITLLTRARHGGRLTSEIRDVVRAADANLPIVAASTLNDQGSPVLMQLRLAAWISAGVGAIAILLATIGIYGVTAYTVSRRTREIGIRVAMGAEPADVVRMVMRQGMSLVAIGGAIGLLLAAATSRVLVRLLFGLPPIDPVTFGGAALLFAAIGLTACFVPVRRATRINAADALRYE
jgi:predicted permease